MLCRGPMQLTENMGRANMLRRNTPFTCNISFHCDLPEPPSDAKMLIAPLQPEKLAKFAITSLERNPRRELTLEPGLGIHVGLVDTSQYSVTDPTATLSPEDLALLEGETEFASEAKGHRKIRERLRGSNAELSWLMRTSYISNETEARKQAAAAAPRMAEDDAGNGSLTADEVHLRDAEASFDAAQQMPVHPTNPSLSPIEITPVCNMGTGLNVSYIAVLPDFDRWGDNYVLINFEGDPTADHPRLSALPLRKRQQIAGEAIAKSYALPGGDRKPFLAYMIPKDTSPDEGVDDDIERAPRTGEYEWVREYQYNVSNTRDAESNATYLLQFEGGRCSYLDLNTRMRCMKRTRGSQGAAPRTEFPRPSKILVQNREKTEAELTASEARRGELMSMSV